MDEKELLKVKKHILEFREQTLIDRIYGKNGFEDEVLDVMKEEKDYGSYKFIGELLINVLSTQKLIETDFYGGFNENEHYFIVNSIEDVERFKEMLLEIKGTYEVVKSIDNDVKSFLKKEYQDNEEIIQRMKELVNKKSVTKDKKTIYILMKEALEYVSSRKSLSDLFKVGVNYYKNLEKEFEEDR